MLNTLHNHTAGLDSVGTVKMLVDRIREVGDTTYAAICDHGTVISAYELNKLCLSIGIKPVHGIEFYIVNKWTTNKKLFHLTCLAKNHKGFLKIIELLNHPTSIIYSRKLAISFDTLCSLADENIVLLSGCSSSPFQQLPMETVELLLTQIPCEIYAEIMLHSNTDYSKAVFQRALKLVSLGLKPIVTNDSHYILKSDYNIHTLRMVDKKWRLPQEIATQLFIKSNDELLMLANAYLTKSQYTVFEQGVELAEFLPTTFESYILETPLELPSTGVDDSELFLRSFVPDDLSLAERERIEYEFEIFRTLHVLDYFVLLSQIVHHLRNSGILVSLRGSAAGSLLLFYMKINPVHPLIYDIPIERFMNPYRADLADVDLDVSDKELANKVIQQHFPHSASIMTLITYKQDSINNLLRTNNVIPPANIDRLLGSVKTWGKHAGGVLLSKNPITTLPKHGDSVAVTMHQFTDKGAQKFDILGVKALNLVQRIGLPTDGQLRVNGQTDVTTTAYHSEFIKPRPSNIGIWQLGTYGGQKLAKMLQPTNIEELALISAFNRPSALENDLHQVYFQVKNSLCENPYSKIIQDIVGDDLVPVYQEHIMNVLSVYIAYNNDYPFAKAYALANKARKYLSKTPYDISQKSEYIQADLKKIFGLFIKGCNIANVPDNEIAQTLEIIEAMAKYGFCKGHAVAYAWLSAATAYLKKTNALEFYTQFLNVYDEPENVTKALNEISIANITISVPSVSSSSYEFINDGQSIIIPPLWFVSGVGRKTALKIFANKPYFSVQDAVEKLGKKVFSAKIISMIDSGRINFK